MTRTLLNSLTIDECEEEAQREAHNEEINSIIENFVNGGWFVACHVSIKPYESRKGFVLVRTVSDIDDVLEGTDYKNGMDVYKIENGLLFRVFGQSFSKDHGKTWETVTEDVYIISTEYRYF